MQHYVQAGPHLRVLERYLSLEGHGMWMEVEAPMVALVELTRSSQISMHNYVQAGPHLRGLERYLSLDDHGTWMAAHAPWILMDPRLQTAYFGVNLLVRLATAAAEQPLC